MRISRFDTITNQYKIIHRYMCYLMIILLMITTLLIIDKATRSKICRGEATQSKICRGEAEMVSFDMYDGGSNDPEPIAASEGVVDIEWSHFTDYPRGNQDNAGAIYKDQLFSTGGFCGGDVYPYYCKGPKAFYSDTYLYNFQDEQWKRIEDMPGLGRQGHKCETINDEVYCFGGFSYSEPYVHIDSYKYNGSWYRIHDLPSKHTAAIQICTMNNKIYFLEAADYDLYQFYTNKNLYEYDLYSWKLISVLPGTARWSTDITCHNNEIYVIGGVSANDEKFNVETNSHDDAIYATIIDNWKYSILSDSWTRLSDTPFVLGNWMFQTVYDNYILLIGGAGYMSIYNSTSVKKPDNMNHQHSPLNRNISNDYLFTNAVYVYNIITDTFIQSTPLPYDWNGATVWLRGDTVYLNAGELGTICTDKFFYSRHPKMTLKGKITIK